MTTLERYKHLLAKAEAEKTIVLVEAALEIDELNDRINDLKREIKRMDVSARGNDDETN